VEAAAARVLSQAQMGGGREEAWGARAHVHYDWLPGLGMTFDLYQERSKSEDVINLVGRGAPAAAAACRGPVQGCCVAAAAGPPRLTPPICLAAWPRG
jgi:hypothetical protein